MTGTLHEVLWTFIIASWWILLRIAYISSKIYRENQNTYVMFKKNFPPRKSGRLSENVEEYGTDGQAADENIMRLMRFACRTPKATKPRSEYAILFTPQQHFFLCTYITYVISFSYMCSWGLLSSGNDTASLDYRFQKFWNKIANPSSRIEMYKKDFF